MASFDGRIILRYYNWAASSFLRVIMGVILMTAVLTAAYLLTPVYVATPVSFAVLLALGYSAYNIRRSGAALDFPGIDRFFQQVPCYITIQDRNLRIMRSNREFRRAFGPSRGELCYMAYKGRKDVCPDCPVLKTFEDGQTRTTEETVVTKDGKTANMIVYTTPVTNEEGAVVGVMEMSTDITRIKELQQQIEISRKEYQNLFERVPCFISIIDRDYRITRHNRLFEKEFGECVGRRCYQVYHKRTSVCDTCEVRRTFLDGQIHGLEKTVVKPDGTPIDMMVYTSPIYDDDHNIQAVMEMATDITETKKLQRELTYMGRTIAAMAHRIKNILMGLEGGIFVVNTGLEDKDDDLVKQGWEMIERNVKLISVIVRDLLYCSKEREMLLVEVSPAEIVGAVYDLFSGRARKEGVELIKDINESLPAGRFDAEALHSLLTNLTTNALDACINDATEGKDHHYIVIRARYDSRSGYVFEVEDNGAGIPGAIGESIFEDFFSTKGREGTGLGLLVAQKVAEQHGGTITFTSDEGQKTIFRAVVPAKRN